MEACELFHYHCLDDVPKDEFDFSFALHTIHEAREADEVKELLGLQDLQTLYNPERLEGLFW